MLEIAWRNLKSAHTALRFAQLDFTTSWSGQFVDADIDAVTSSMAIHHADDKGHLFR